MSLADNSDVPLDFAANGVIKERFSPPANGSLAGRIAETGSLWPCWRRMLALPVQLKRRDRP
jgi:hypothetical protein